MAYGDKYLKMLMDNIRNQRFYNIKLFNQSKHTKV